MSIGEALVRSTEWLVPWEPLPLSWPTYREKGVIAGENPDVVMAMALPIGILT